MAPSHKTFMSMLQTLEIEERGQNQPQNMTCFVKDQYTCHKSSYVLALMLDKRHDGAREADHIVNLLLTVLLYFLTLHTFFVKVVTAALMALRRPVSLQRSSTPGASRHMRRHLADACGTTFKCCHATLRRDGHAKLSPCSAVADDGDDKGPGFRWTIERRTT